MPKSDPAHTLDLLWRTTAPPRRGPRGSISVEQVVRAAVEIADDEGLDAVSMRRVAERVGVTTMSLYRYVPGKGDLQDMMFDHASGVPDTSQWGDGRDWRARLEDFARQMRARSHSRPWMLDVPLRTPPMGPNNLAWMDAALQAMEGTELGEGDKMGALNLIAGFVRNEAVTYRQLHRATEETGVSPDAWGAAYGQVLARVLAEGRFPALARVVGAGVFEQEDAEDGDFEYGLAFILDGLAARMPSAGGEDDRAPAASPTG